VVIGVTTTFGPVKAPGFHVYEVAPPAVNVALFPAQIAVEDAAAVIDGTEFTVIRIVLVAVQPNAVVPVTE